MSASLEIIKALSMYMSLPMLRRGVTGVASVLNPDLCELGPGHDDWDFDVFEGDGEESEEFEELLWVWDLFVAIDDYLGTLGRHFVFQLQWASLPSFRHKTAKYNILRRPHTLQRIAHQLFASGDLLQTPRLQFPQ